MENTCFINRTNELKAEFLAVTALTSQSSDTAAGKGVGWVTGALVNDKLHAISAITATEGARSRITLWSGLKSLLS